MRANLCGRNQSLSSTFHYLFDRRMGCVWSTTFETLMMTGSQDSSYLAHNPCSIACSPGQRRIQNCQRE
ncbi:hypothetical protein VTN49DRAFT_346 [Thermomyces lanuginosus]|uniref:uncharacterized protein n=1 Tax=Thermomyces lanuginosus TaxID=5541 RepID=UPI00374206B1